MSYIHVRPRPIPARPRRARRARGLGDFVDDLKTYVEGKNEVACLDAANASPQVADIDKQTLDLAKNWQPTGFYSPAELSTVVTQITKLITGARAALATAPPSTSDAAQVIRQAYTYLDKSYQNVEIYTAAIATARANGTTAIHAPGLKSWVTGSMVNVSQAYVTVATLACRMTWLDTAAGFFNTAYNVIKRIAGLVIKAADTVLKVADDVLGLYDVLKWGALGVGALYAYKWLAPMLRRS